MYTEGGGVSRRASGVRRNPRSLPTQPRRDLRELIAGRLEILGDLRAPAPRSQRGSIFVRGRASIAVPMQFYGQPTGAFPRL
jgi:hypothetical protein